MAFIDLGWFALPMTLIWILAITNAVNLIDGLDGLAKRRLYYQFDDDRDYQLFSLEFCGSTNGHFTLIAAIIGFFPYNFYPATIFLEIRALFLDL